MMRAHISGGQSDGTLRREDQMEYLRRENQDLSGLLAQTSHVLDLERERADELERERDGARWL